MVEEMPVGRGIEVTQATLQLTTTDHGTHQHGLIHMAGLRHKLWPTGMHCGCAVHSTPLKVLYQ